MGQSTLVLGLQPADMDSKSPEFFANLGADVFAYQTGNIQSVDYSKGFIDRAASCFNGETFLCGMDSHDFNNWDDDAHWKTVINNSVQIASYMKAKGATGFVLNCEQENHLIPAGKFSQRSDPQFVWPSGKNGPKRCQDWVNAIKAVWPDCQFHLWLTSAVQVNANPGFYPCINAICEAAGGAHLWAYMWEPGYGFGSDPNLPKRKTLPQKYQKGKTWLQIGKPDLWKQTVLATFTQKVKNTIHPCLSFEVGTVQYYQNKIKAGQVKDFSGMMQNDLVNFYGQIGNGNLIVWGDCFEIEPYMTTYVQQLLKKLKG